MIVQKPDNHTTNPPSYEETWKQSLNGLQQQVAEYETVQRSGDDQAIENEVPRVASAMRNVGDSHTDPEVKVVWHKKADKFLRSSRATRSRIVQDVGKLVIGVISIPFSVVGCALCTAGNIVRGVGSGIVGLGEFLSGHDKDDPLHRR
jgi:hypothetical protein